MPKWIFHFNKRILILTFVIILGGFLRFYQLGFNPPSLTWDEASWGYNAYSLGIDGRDEFGRFLPYDYLESFGDYKPPMYAYLTIAPVKVFGLNEFSTRFTSAFFGTLTILVTYFLVKSLFPMVKNSDTKALKDNQNLISESIRFSQLIPIIASLLLAISPWHIMLSRAAFEANISTFFIGLGVLLFLKGIGGKGLFLPLSVLTFCLSIYTFNSARVVAPLLLISLTIVFYKQMLKRKKVFAIAVITGFIVVMPIFKFLISPQASLRFKEVNIFSNSEIVKTANQEILNDNNAVWSKIIHNRRIGYAREMVKHYFDNLSSDFLFINGDGNPKFSTRDTGQMLLFELPFLILGFMFLIKRRQANWLVIPLWLFIGILPASLARETPHALRIEGALPTFQIITSYGIGIAWIWLTNLKGKLARLKNIALYAVCLIALVNFVYYLHGYYSHYANEFSGEWQYGYKESIEYLNSVEGKYDSIYFADFLGRPYIYLLFYKQYSPEDFRRNAVIKRDVFGFVNVDRVEKYYFPKEITYDAGRTEKILYVNHSEKVPKTAKIIKTFYLLNDEPNIVIYTL